MTYAQNKEDQFVLDYFGDFKGMLLDIGANDGVTFSNSRLLIESGWSAQLIEPGLSGIELFKLYEFDKKVQTYGYGIGEHSGIVKFFESGSHIPNGIDRGLVSTTNFEETIRWANVEFVERKVELITFDIFLKSCPVRTFDFISIDAEGNDWKILQQIDLEAVGCRVLCIEWNGNPELLRLFTDYCKGYTLAIKNAENLIFMKETTIERIPPIVDQMGETILKRDVIMGNVKIGAGVTSKVFPSEGLPNRYKKFSKTSTIVRYNTNQTTISQDKNNLIKQLYDAECDYIFIFDDDTFPIKQGWEQFFIDASNRTGFQHFILGNDEHLNMVGFSGGLYYFQKGTGCMLFITRKVIETVGYLNNKYGKYGYEHAAYSNRIHRAGLTPAWYTSVEGWEEYIYAYDLQKEDAEKHGFVKEEWCTPEDKAKYIAKNEPVFKKEMSSRALYLDYEQKNTGADVARVLYYALDPSDTTSMQRIHGVLPYIRHKDFFLIDISFVKNFNPEVLRSAKVLILQRPFTPDHVQLIVLAKQEGVKVILDYDDDLFSVDMFNPTFQMYRQFQNSIEDCIKIADELWVSTDAIKESYKHFNTHVIPNAHNDYLYPVSEKRLFNTNKKVLYRGGLSHRADVYEYGEKLVKVINQNLDWTFLIMGDRFEWLEQRTGDNHHIIGGMAIAQYYAYIYDENPSVFIFPLCNTKFNEGKSNICWMEATYVGAAFFGNTGLPEFNKPGIVDLKMLPEAIKGGHWGFMMDKNEESWTYICENLLLSSINKIREERILANL